MAAVGQAGPQGTAWRTGLAVGRGSPTVALFPAGAENFASIGAARERETSTPGYRPSLQRRGGQQGGTLSPASPRIAMGKGPARSAPGWAMLAQGAWHTVPDFGSRHGARTECLPVSGPHKEHPMHCPASWQRPDTRMVWKQVQHPQTSPPYLQSASLFTACCYSVAHRPSSHTHGPTCAAQQRPPLPMPCPHPAQQDGHFVTHGYWGRVSPTG